MNRWCGSICALVLWACPALAHAYGEASLLMGRSYPDAFFLQDKTGFGGTIGGYSNLLGIELGIDYMPVSEFTVGGADLGASFINLMGNFVVQIPVGNFVPYGTIGYGALIADSDPEFESVDFLGTFGALNYGFGGKLFFTDTIGVRVDYRRFAVQTGDDVKNLEIPFTGIRIDSGPDFDRLMFGMAFRW